MSVMGSGVLTSSLSYVVVCA